jgi:hypothetical protein
MKNEKISEKIRQKSLVKKILTSRVKARINKVISKEFPYVTIDKIYLDLLSLTPELNKEYDEILNELRKFEEK